MLVNKAAALERSEDVDSLWGGIVDTLRRAGFDQAVYITIRHDNTESFWRSTIDDLYDQMPAEEDPFLRLVCDTYQVRTIGAAFMDDYPMLREDERDVVRFAARNGLNAALSVPTRLRGSERYGGFIVGNGMDRATFAEQMVPKAEEVRLFCLLMHRRIEELTIPSQSVDADGDMPVGRTMVAPDLPDAFSSLSPREREVIYLLAHGRSRKEAARLCGLSVHTVSDYTKSAYRKLGVRNRAQVATMIHANGQGD